MKQGFCALLAVAAAAMIHTGLPAQDAKQKVSYAEYMKAVTDKLPELKKNRLQVLKAENTLAGAGATDDISLTAGGSYNSSDEYSSSFNGTTRNVTVYSFNAGISRKFTATGTTVEAGIGHESMTADDYGASYSPSVYIQFSQSVLKNSFGVVDRYAVNNASMQLEIDKLKKSESDKSALNYYKKLYFTWIETAARIELMNESVRYAEAIESDTAKKYRSGLAPEEDLLSARAVVMQYKISAEELLSAFAEIEAGLNLFLPAGTAPDNSELDARYKEVSSAVYPDIPFGETANAGVYRLAKSRLEYTKDVGENRLLPRLDITGRYTRKSMNEDYQGAWSGLDNSDYYIGFTASYPLWNSEESAALREAELAIEEINEEYAISENRYRTDAARLRKASESAGRMIELTGERIRLLQSRYDAVYRKYRQGNYQIQQVIDTLREITEEKTKLVKYKNTLIQYYIDYSDLTG